MATLVLQTGETLLRKDFVSLVGKRVVSRTGVCYLTNQRIVVDSESLLAGAGAAVSIIARTVLRKAGQLGARRQEAALERLSRISLGKYGINKTVDVPLSDGTTLRMVMNARQRRQWLAALDQALAARGLRRVPEGEEAWRIRPAE